LKAVTGYHMSVTQPKCILQSTAYIIISVNLAADIMFARFVL